MFCTTSYCWVVFILYQPFSVNTGFKRLLNVEVISNFFLPFVMYPLTLCLIKDHMIYCYVPFNPLSDH